MNQLNQPHKISPTLTCFVAIFFAFTCWTATSYAQGDPCEYPLFIQQNSETANLLFIFDSSGSMNTVLYHDDYDRTQTYAGNFSNGAIYNISADGWYKPSDFDFSWPTAPSAYLVASDMGQASRYEGNYLDWIFFNATEAQRSTIPTVTRIMVAKAAVADIIQNTENLRFGIMRFNGDTGGYLVSPIGTETATLLTSLNTIVGDGWTPLAETMVDAMEYFQGTGAGAPIEYYCQKNFIVVVTDGYPTMDLNVPAYIGDYDGDGSDPGTCGSMGSPDPNSSNCSDYLDDVALYIKENDLRGDLEGTQNAITYTVGFNIDANILQDTADNGGGLYYSANSSAELRTSLGSVLTDILSRMSSGSAVAVVSSENSTDNRIFRAKFLPNSWKGYLEAFELPYDNDDQPVWEAGALLKDRDASSRDIYTSSNGFLTSFDTGASSALMASLGAVDVNEAADIIEYVRGVHIDGCRDREGWKLGDIVSSSPVIVGPPQNFYLRDDYMSFRAANALREPVIYVGANDGMLHCFRASDGYELWAFIPESSLGNLVNLLDPMYCHNFFVNSTPRVVDAHVGGSWRTILVCGQGEGGTGYFSLDVTDPYNPYLLWDVSIAAFGESWPIPEIARVRNLDRYVAFVGSGPDDTDGEAHLIALDLQTGQVLWSDLLSVSVDVNMTTSALTLDTDFDGYDDLLYVNDLAGHLWRFDLTGNSWGKSLLFSADQPFQAAPIMTVDEFERVLLYFGTGRYLTTDDMLTVDQQTFYCIIDDHSGASISRADLVDQTSTITSLSEAARGWYIDLHQASGERIIKPDALVAGVVYFSSFAPSDEECGSGGHSWLYAVDFRDGSAADNEDGSENDVTTGRVQDVGSGIGSDPIFDFTNEQIVIQLNNTQISTVDAVTRIQHLIVRSWREKWD